MGRTNAPPSVAPRVAPSLVALLLAAVGAGCATLSPEDEAPVEEPEEEVEPEEDEELDLQYRIVIADVDGGVGVGDSVAVALEPTPPTGARGEVHQPEEARGVVLSATELGPLPGSEGRVTATTLNVRSCPGTECDPVGSLRMGQLVEIHDVEDGWYALDEAGSRWASVRHIVGEEGWSEVAAGMVLSQFRSFWDQYLAGRVPEARPEGEELFSEWHLGVDGDALQLLLASNYNQGPGGQEVCRWAYSSAEVLEGLAGQLAGYGVSEHHVAVHYQGDEGQPVARLDDDGEITCILR